MPIEPTEWEEAEAAETLFDEVERFFRENPDDAFEVTEVMSELRQGEPDVDEEVEELSRSMARAGYNIVLQSLVREGVLRMKSSGNPLDENSWKAFKLAEEGD